MNLVMGICVVYIIGKFGDFVEVGGQFESPLQGRNGRQGHTFIECLEYKGITPEACCSGPDNGQSVSEQGSFTFKIILN